MILNDKDLNELLTEDQQAKIKLLAALNKSIKFHRQQFDHHAERLRTAMASLEAIEMSKNSLFPEVTK